MRNISSFFEDTLPTVKMEEGEINQEHGELDLSDVNKETCNLNYVESDMEVANKDLEELEDIHQYVMAKLAVELAPSHLLPPGWSISSTSLLLPPTYLNFYFRLYLNCFEFSLFFYLSMSYVVFLFSTLIFR